ncbi:hypothetical protein ASE70_11120 [Sphingomonas sp. Leaf22]|uniref:hypothetical protein n=1 Tax=Sphingomonas sp. Leaf22 TaxID=1735687 RepID=UPI0006FD69BD|nr:hypothetical protein [Sphingomonas sp. Leaf22]KQM94347.1 hypothetical protein ASE70_11120 [Sphingomonas sp. Leaf22]
MHFATDVQAVAADMPDSRSIRARIEPVVDPRGIGPGTGEQADATEFEVALPDQECAVAMV